MTPERHAQFIYDNATQYAKAKSNRIGAELKLKSCKAVLMKHFSEQYPQIAAQEREAYADGEYTKLINELRAAVIIEEQLKYQLEASRLSIDIWRTREASERLAIRSHE